VVTLSRPGRPRRRSRRRRRRERERRVDDVDDDDDDGESRKEEEQRGGGGGGDASAMAMEIHRARLSKRSRAHRSRGVPFPSTSSDGVEVGGRRSGEGRSYVAASFDITYDSVDPRYFVMSRFHHGQCVVSYHPRIETSRSCMVP